MTSPRLGILPSSGVQPWQSGWNTSTTSTATTSPSHAVSVNSKLTIPRERQRRFSEAEDEKQDLQVWQC
ncbi:hypothetical protein CgunFtcFv8_021267 [Champsocephalus gunnari]|uniref:Uncharacterized protein n=1 Tax=Champsocephalus gunnari TaxID=52237 RepID=A0AAN8I0I7_CHAGU|nr:hypothetical protein CgunFtcFv8_021267 [Champsocephalus gunnari]